MVMSGLRSVERLPLLDGRSLIADEAGGWLTLYLDSRPFERFAVKSEGHRIVLANPWLDPDASFSIWAASYWLFARHPRCLEVEWNLPEAPEAAQLDGLLVPAASRWLTRRELFWQLPQPWLRRPHPDGGRVVEGDDGHGRPHRPAKPSGEVYRRFDARLGQWVSLRALEIDLDLERFHRWQNSPRVLRFWQEGGTLEQHRTYLERIAGDPHAISLIGCFNHEPCTYFEVYWAMEDRIAPFYDVHAYDRGMHMLVGEEAHRGPHKVASWLPALIHYLFLDELRTQTLVAEPRADNSRMIGYLQEHGFHKRKEFDLPHKRAALMAIPRDTFFKDCRLV